MSSAQPPPRKGAYAKHVQNLHKDQFNAAQLKNSQELDLLDDIRYTTYLHTYLPTYLSTYLPTFLPT